MSIDCKTRILQMDKNKVLLTANPENIDDLSLAG